jgi:hypothetical protein
MSPCPRQGARRHRPKAPSIDGCPLRCLRIAGDPPPHPRLCRRRIGFRRLAVLQRRSGIGFRHLLPPSLERLDPRGIQGSSPQRRAGLAPPVDFCNHHGSPAQATERPTTPRIEPGAAPLRDGCGRPCTSRCKAGQAVSEPGATKDVTPSPAPSPAMTRREALPRPDRLGHLLSRNRACTGRRSRVQVRGTRFPRVRRRPDTQRRRPH